MSLAVVHSRALSGANAPPVAVEVHIGNGLPAVNLVGLPDTEVRESRERVRAALKISGFDFPARKVTVNLAPADLPKESGRFDLPIALGVLAASGVVTTRDIRDIVIVGELAVGTAVVTGLFTRLSAAVALLMNVNFLLLNGLTAGGAIDAAWIVLEIVIIAGASRQQWAARLR